jgi:signal transduction histidine kinase
VMALAVGLVGLLLLANPLPSYTQVTQLNLSATPALGELPVLILVYPLYIVLCVSLSLDALWRPGPTERVMGDLARRRARPWLVAASLVLLLVSLLVTWVMVWIIVNARQRSFYGLYTDMALTIAWFDLIIATLIAVAIISLGRAIVSYEVFTGQTLPRYGFFRHWRSAVILAAGYGVVVGWSLRAQLRPVYSLLLTTLLMTLFYALFSWRSFVERKIYIQHLRPFVTSQRLYERVLAPSATSTIDPALPFRALCAEVLDTRRAYLAALGPLAPLVGPALVYPADALPLPVLGDLIAQLNTPQTVYVPLDPARYADTRWAVPLWSERGLIGVLLLGEKRNGGVYTQEEIEIARASGERLIDTQAGVEMARRLMALQRQHLAETQVLDHRPRRILHDEILPRLHAALLTLSGVADNATTEAIQTLTEVHHRLSDLLREMPAAIAPEVARLGLVGALRRVISAELAEAFDQVTWHIEPAAEHHAQKLPPLTAEVLFYAARESARNAARYGRGEDASRPLHLEIDITWRDQLEIRSEDDGVGLVVGGQADSGSGQGLALHSTMMAVIGGTLTVESAPEVYTRVLLTLPQGT